MAKAKKIIFSIPEATIVKYSSKEAFCEDAQGTVWCDDEFYNNLVSPILTYGEIYIISVHSPIKGDFKILLIRSDQDNYQHLYDKNGEFVRSSNKDILNDEEFSVIMHKLQYSRPDYLVEKLKMFVTGRVDDSIFDSIPFLEYVDVKEPIGQSELVFDFSEHDDEVEKLFYLYDYDLYYIKCAYNLDPTCEIGEDPGFLLDDQFAEGDSILPDYFYQDNQAKQLAKKIYKLFDPNFNFENRGFDEWKKVNSLLVKMFREELYDFMRTQVHYADKASYVAMRKEILEDLEEIKRRTGLMWNPSFGEVRVKLGDAFAFLTQNNLSYVNFLNAMSDYFEKANHRISGYNEGRWEFFDEDNFDTEGFSIEVLPILENIFNELNSPKLRESLKVYQFLTDNFGRGSKLINPTTKEDYRIDKIDLENGTISFSSWGGYRTNQFTMTNQEFVDWMTNEKLKLESQNILLSLQQILSDDQRKNRLT